MTISKVIYGSRALVDLIEDIITIDTLSKDCTVHRKDGIIIMEILFEGYPDTQQFYDSLSDANGTVISDNSDAEIEGKTVYRKV